MFLNSKWLGETQDDSGYFKIDVIKFGILCTSSILKSFIQSQQIRLEFGEVVEAIRRVNQNKY
jgi:hypothetical protein